MASAKNTQKAILALANGEVFFGNNIGASGMAVGEVVFHTALCGYQEILTDPSYAEQMIVFTYPHIGNTGINNEDGQSNRIWAKGVIIRDCPNMLSNYRSTQDLSSYLVAQQTVAISGIDTRYLTNLIRSSGGQGGCIMSIDNHQDRDALCRDAVAEARAFPGLLGMDLTGQVTCKDSQCYPAEGVGGKVYTVVAYDFGIKKGIVDALTRRNCKVTCVPATTTVEDILQMKPKGIIFSNGPGDPMACRYAIDTIQKLVTKRIPLLGICLGFQLLALALGAKTKKMKFGHHGSNHPVYDRRRKTVTITSQNHGFAVDESSLPNHLEVTHHSLFDQSLQGFAHKELPLMGVQGHPEANPGPQEWQGIFDDFIALIERYA